jgi:hypothetical protein
MEKESWKSITAGILTIVAGVFGFTRILHPFRPLFNPITPGTVPHPRTPGVAPHMFNFTGNVHLAIAITLGVLGVLAIVGGVYALKRKIWGLALAGSIAAIFGSFPLGIAGLVLTVLSKKEFE